MPSFTAEPLFPAGCDISIRVDCPWFRWEGLWSCLSYMTFLVTWQICHPEALILLPWSSHITHSAIYSDFGLAERIKNLVPFSQGNSVRVVIYLKIENSKNTNRTNTKMSGKVCFFFKWNILPVTGFNFNLSHCFSGSRPEGLAKCACNSSGLENLGGLGQERAPNMSPTMGEPLRYSRQWRSI